MSNSTWKKFSPSDFTSTEKLYRGYEKFQVDETGKISLNTIRFPDFSCNWSRFSTAKDIRLREGGKSTDGCYSFTVEISRFGNMATPCHDPIDLNYSHTEVRQLKTEEPIFFEPPKARKLKSDNWSRSKKLRYRQNMIHNLIIELDAEA